MAVGKLEGLQSTSSQWPNLLVPNARTPFARYFPGDGLISGHILALTSRHLAPLGQMLYPYKSVR